MDNFSIILKGCYALLITSLRYPLKNTVINSLRSRWQTFDPNPRQYWGLSLLWLGLLSWLAFLWNLGALGLMDKTEALFVEVAHQMYLTGDWITPRWNGQTFFDYPVWGYWVVALSFKLFGVSEWAARLPAALSAIALVLGSFYTLRITGFTWGEQQATPRSLWLRACLGAGIVAMNPGWVGWGRTSVTDMFLSSAIALALLSFFVGYTQFERGKTSSISYGLATVFAAIAVLAKGPVGVLLPLLIMGIFLLYVGQFKAVIQEMPLLPMVGIFAVVVIPWYALATQANGWDFLSHFIGFSNFQRFTSVLYRHAGPWYFYLPWCFILLLPWSIYLPLAITRLQFWRRKAWQSSPRSQQLGLFCGVWFAVVLLFFSSAATKLAGYILPLVPAGAILITLFFTDILLTHREQTGKSWPLLTSGIVNTILLAILAIAAFLSPTFADDDPAYPTFATALQSSGLPWILGGILTLATVVSLGLLIQHKTRVWLWIPNLLGFFLTLLLVIPPLAPLMDSQRQQPFRELGIELGQKVLPQEPIFLMGYPRYSLVYYSQHPVTFLDDVPYALELVQPGKDQNPSPTVIIVSEPRFLERFKLQPKDYQQLVQRGVYTALRVDKKTLLNKAQPKQDH